MVVCKCRKATKLYCFVHKVPVCGECICFPEHQTCVVRTYSEWVIDGEYDWPPVCCQCKATLQEGVDHQTTRLGCLHVIHTSCLISHIKTFPQHTAPAGYVCPGCSTSIWPPKSVKDSGSRLHSKLKEAIVQTGIEKNVFGNHPAAELHGPPPAFASDPLKRVSNGGREDVQSEKNVAARYSFISGGGSTSASASEIVEVDVPFQEKSLASNHEPNYMKSASPEAPGATTRKGSMNVERQNSEMSYFADDEEGNKKKYTRRGPFRHKFLRALLPFWSSALPTLPVTAPSRTDDTSEGRPRRHRSSRMDPRKILLVIAIMACMATMGILYYRIAQGGPGQRLLDEENVP